MGGVGAAGLAADTSGSAPCGQCQCGGKTNGIAKAEWRSSRARKSPVRSGGRSRLKSVTGKAGERNNADTIISNNTNTWRGNGGGSITISGNASDAAVGKAKVDVDDDDAQVNDGDTDLKKVVETRKEVDTWQGGGRIKIADGGGGIV